MVDIKMSGVKSRFSYNDLEYELICADSKEYLIQLRDIDLIIGSPPYADQREYDTIKSIDYVDWFKDYAELIYNSLSEIGVFVLNISSKTEKGIRLTYPYEILIYLVEYGFCFIDNIIWNKGKCLVHANSRRPASVYENCFVFSKNLNYTWNSNDVRTTYDTKSITRMKYKIPRRYSRYNNDTTKNKKTWSPNPKGAYPKNIINIGSESKRVSDLHTSVYPVKFVDWFIKAFTNEKDLVVDPWGGSASTLISAIKNKRRCISIEKNYEFYNESIKRVNKVIKIE